jgi:hypothetical protein
MELASEDEFLEQSNHQLNKVKQPEKNENIGF